MDKFIKITNTTNIKSSLYKNINAQRIKHSKDYKKTIDNSLVDCESPIEQLFSMALESYKLDNFHILNPNIKLLKYSRQEIFIARNEEKSRLDFYFEFLFKDNGLDGSIYKFAVEIDGKNYHDKEDIKELTKRRWLANSLNGGLITFDGHEVYYKTNDCVERFILEVINKHNEYIRGKNIFKRNGVGM